MTDKVVRVVAENGKRYKVALRQQGGELAASWVCVQMPGSYNRAGGWRLIDSSGRTGKLAVAAAIETVTALPDNQS